MRVQSTVTICCASNQAVETVINVPNNPASVWCTPQSWFQQCSPYRSCTLTLSWLPHVGGVDSNKHMHAERESKYNTRVKIWPQSGKTETGQWRTFIPRGRVPSIVKHLITLYSDCWVAPLIVQISIVEWGPQVQQFFLPTATSFFIHIPVYSCGVFSKACS